MQVPSAFIEQMKRLLPEEAEELDQQMMDLLYAAPNDLYATVDWLEGKGGNIRKVVRGEP